MLGLGLTQVINFFFNLSLQWTTTSLSWSFFIFRPSTFDLRLWQTQPPQPLQHPFTAAGSRFAQPATDGTGRRTHVVYDKTAMVAEMVQLGCDLVTGVWEKWGKQRWRQWWSWCPGWCLEKTIVCLRGVFVYVTGIPCIVVEKTIEKQTENVKSL